MLVLQTSRGATRPYPMPLRLILAALHAWVGWRIAPSLGWVGGTLFGALLVASAILMPMTLLARGVRSRR